MNILDKYMSMNNKIILSSIISFILGLAFTGGGLLIYKHQNREMYPTDMAYQKCHSMKCGNMENMMNHSNMGMGMGMNMQNDMSMQMGSMTSSLEGKKGEEFDKEFLSQMIIHHQGAVDMAKMALENASHQEIKDLATAIIEAQEKEISQMKEWQKSWGY